MPQYRQKKDWWTGETVYVEEPTWAEIGASLRELRESEPRKPKEPAAPSKSAGELWWFATKTFFWICIALPGGLALLGYTIEWAEKFFK
jgi:hypothetical protein